MDGQRRIAQSMKRHRRRRMLRMIDGVNQSLWVHVAARSGSVVVLAGAIMLGLSGSGQIETESRDSRTPTDRLANLIGFAATDITVTGLTNHDAVPLLKVIGVKPGASLVGFEAGPAKRLLEGIDWVEEATIQRKFPNQLDISIVERQPFALWQRGKVHYVIDRHGVAMSGIPSARAAQLPLVSGEGANTAVGELVDELGAHPELLVRVGAAARVGERRWTLYLDNGVKVLLPETGVADALKTLSEYDHVSGILARGIVEIDMRDNQKMRVALAELPESAGAQ
jgi:cell division protein FtsQ